MLQMLINDQGIMICYIVHSLSVIIKSRLLSSTVAIDCMFALEDNNTILLSLIYN